MDELLNQWELYFSPLGLHFNVEEIKNIILAMPYSHQDEFVPNIFLVFMDEDSKTSSILDRRADSAKPLPYVFLVGLKPTEISINLFAGPEYKPHARLVIEALLKKYDCAVRNEEGTDLTSHYKMAKLNQS